MELAELIPMKVYPGELITSVGYNIGFSSIQSQKSTVKILKIGTAEIITIIVLQLERLDFTVQYCVQKMQTE